jgi:hypothetical protein
MMTTHIIWNIHVLFYPLIYDAFCTRLCLTMLSPDKVIIHETTLSQVFMDNLAIFKYHNVLAYFIKAIYCLLYLTWSELYNCFKKCAQARPIRWMADRIIKHSGTTNPICQLCRAHSEPASHMSMTCSYSQQDWHGLRDRLSTDLQPPPTSSYCRLKTWCHIMLSSDIQGHNAGKERATKFCYAAWNILKERCCRSSTTKLM